MKHSAQMPRRGFLLFEMIVALTVYALIVIPLVRALILMAAVASLAQSELRITRILDSALNETISLPVLEEGQTNTTVDDTDIELNTTIELIEDLMNEDGEILQEMYRIEIIARWYDNGKWQERTVETWRYGRMYQP